MALKIAESAWGMKPCTTPKLFKTYSALIPVLRFQPVNMVSNQVLPATDATVGLYGVAMNHAAAGEDVIVCIDPDMVYTIASDAVVDQSKVGQYFELDNNATTGPTTEVSGCNLRYLSANVAYVGDRALQLVGLDTAIAVGATIYKCRVKIADPKWPQTV